MTDPLRGLFEEFPLSMKTLVKFINDALEELRHVRWPTRQQAVRFSAVVLAFTAVCAALFGALDFVLTQVLNYFISLV